MAGRDGHKGGTKKRSVVKDGKGNPVKTGTGGVATSNDYSKDKPAARTAPAAPAPAKKKAAPAKKKTSAGPTKRPNNAPAKKKTSSGPSKRPNNAPAKAPAKATQAGRSASAGGPTGVITRAKASVAKGTKISNTGLSNKEKHRLTKGIKRDEKKGVKYKGR